MMVARSPGFGIREPYGVSLPLLTILHFVHRLHYCAFDLLCEIERSRLCSISKCCSDTYRAT